MSPRVYSRLETATANPGWPTVRRLIVTLDLPLEFFFPAETILAAADRVRAAAG